MATSLTTLKSRIASELHRDDLEDEIASAISTAITFYQSKRFEFNQRQASFNTANGTESYTTATIPDDIGQLDSLRIMVSGTRYLLEPIAFQRLQDLSSTTTSTGAPTRYAFYAQTLFLYPIPDATYPVLVSYLQRKDPPANDADDTTIWTNQCEALIRSCAKKLICRDVTIDTDGFQRAQIAENEALGALMRESIQLQDEGGMSPSW